MFIYILQRYTRIALRMLNSVSTLGMYVYSQPVQGSWFYINITTYVLITILATNVLSSTVTYYQLQTTILIYNYLLNYFYVMHEKYKCGVH